MKYSLTLGRSRDYRPSVPPSSHNWTITATPLVLGLVRSEDGLPPRQPTRLTLSNDGHAMHVRFDCLDVDFWSTFTCRDEPLWQEEVVEVFLAPGEGDPRRYVEIEVSPAGVVFDAVISNPTGLRRDLVADTAWDCPGLEAAAGSSATGWWASLAIPWRSVLAALGAPEEPMPATWRANFYRIDRPRDGSPPEFSAASPTLVTPADFHRPERFGRLVVEL